MLVEIVYNMYRVKPAAVSGPSQLCHAGNLQVNAIPLAAYIQPRQTHLGDLTPPPGSVTCVRVVGIIQGRVWVRGVQCGVWSCEI
jgi:hypothetical protein